MGRYLKPKNRIARRFGANIFNRKRNPMLHKQNPPGMHGGRRRKKSDFGEQLEEKQKLKAVFGMISEKQLLHYYQKAVKMQGVTPDNLLRLLEMRLDVIVYRMKFAPTIFAAHQLVSHGHIEVDGKKVDIRSFQVKPGMVVSVREKSRNMKLVVDSLADVQREVPEYIDFNAQKFAGSIVRLPDAQEVHMPLPINIAIVCELIAHSH